MTAEHRVRYVYLAEGGILVEPGDTVAAELEAGYQGASQRRRPL